MDEGEEQDIFWGISLEHVFLFHFLNQERIENRLSRMSGVTTV